MASDICKHCSKEFRHNCHSRVSYCSKECRKNKKIWNKGMIGRKSWMNTSGLRAHKKGDFSHSEESREKMSVSRKGSVPWNKGKKSVIEICCENCSSLFSIPPSRMKTVGARFCDRTCSIDFFKKNNTRSMKMKQKWSSEDYRELMMSSFAKSDRVPWNKGVGDASSTRRARMSKSVLGWREVVVFRDGECQLCGEKKNLEAHHIEMFSENYFRRDDITNGICLCKKCHRKLSGKEHEWASYFSFIIDNNLYSKARN